MSKRDYYDVLGLTKSASKDEIRKAYRKLSKNVSSGFEQRGGCGR